jgi:hypothetical protein
MIHQLQNVQVTFASGALAMSGTLTATALADVGWLNEKYYILVTCAAAHGIVAGSQLWFSCLDNVTDGTYKTNKVRDIYSAPATTTLRVAAPEGYTAGTPTTSELYAAGFCSDSPYLFAGFKLHLSAADTSGETLTLTTDAIRGAAWDALIFSKVMTGVTDIIYIPDVPIPMMGGDVIKFSWTNTGAKTWGTEIYTIPRS